MNLGYACINMTLGKQKPKVTTNRSMIKRTFLEKGPEYAGELSLQNARDLFTDHGSAGIASIAIRCP